MQAQRLRPWQPLPLHRGPFFRDSSALDVGLWTPWAGEGKRRGSLGAGNTLRLVHETARRARRRRRSPSEHRQPHAPGNREPVRSCSRANPGIDEPADESMKSLASLP